MSKVFSVLLLYKDLPSSIATVQGLIDKGIRVHTVDSASKLILGLVKRSYDVVGISVCHPSSKSLTKVVKEKFSMPLMVYSETDSEKSIKKISTASADYKVNGVLTSYNAWMKINDLYKKKAAVFEMSGAIKLQENDKKQTARDNRESAIVVKGSKEEKNINRVKKESKGTRSNPFEKEKDGSVKTLEKSSENKEKNLTISLKEDEDSIGKIGEVRKVDTIEKNETGVKKNFSIKAGSKNFSTHEDDKTEGPIGKVQNVVLDKKVNPKNSLSKDVNKEKSNNEETSSPSKFKRKSRSRDRGRKRRGRTSRLMKAGKKRETKPLTAAPLVKDKPINNNNEISPQETNNSNVIDINADNQIIMPDNSLTNKADESTKAFIELMKNKYKPSKIIKKFECSKLSLFPVTQSDKIGFVILSDSKDSSLEDQLLKKFIGNFDIKQQEDSFSIGKEIKLDIEQSDILKWSEQICEYHFQTKIDKNHLLVSFLKMDKMFPKLRKDKHINMYQIPVGDLEPQDPLMFNVFLYLEKNQKVLPYLNTGGAISEKQRLNLIDNEFDQLFISEEDFEKYLQHNALEKLKNNIKKSS